MKASCERCAKSAGCPLRYDEERRAQCPILNADNEPLRYRNSEGYSDPTAFFAFCNVMRLTVLKHKAKAEKKRHPRMQVIHYD